MRSAGTDSGVRVRLAGAVQHEQSVTGGRRGPDRIGGAFLLCGFWMAQVAQVCGDGAAAARWFERNRAACGPAALYTEEYDVHQRQLRGNLPQAFVHAGMLECAARLSAARA